MNPLKHIDLLSLQDRLVLQKDQTGSVIILDPVRKKYIRATPEETVRQLWIIYLLEILGLNPKLIAVERSFLLNGLMKRFDLVVFNKDTTPILLAEFKSPGTVLGQAVFDQIVQYNMQWQVPFALVSNGSMHYVFEVDHELKNFRFLDKLPF